MLFQVHQMQWSRDAEPISRAIKARDPDAILVSTSGIGNLRVVARLDTRRMLDALAEAGFSATPEWQLVA